MLRLVRGYSIKALPFEAQPKNKYNAARSAFNIKPVPTQGLIHNPPASMPSIKETPKAFLPKNDPRLKIFAGKFKTYTRAELDEMPLIYATLKDNSLTPELVEQIVTLRAENPDKWSIAKLAAKFNVDAKKVNVITGVSKEKQAQVLDQLKELKSHWPVKKLHAREDVVRRKHMWLSNKF